MAFGRQLGHVLNEGWKYVKSFFTNYDTFRKTAKYIDKGVINGGANSALMLFTVDDYFPFDDLSYIHMLWIKMLRIRNVVESGGEVNFESAEDSLIDLINYSVLLYAYTTEKTGDYTE